MEGIMETLLLGIIGYYLLVCLATLGLSHLAGR